jgi:hypothetical protein
LRFEELFASTKRWDNVVVQVANGDNVKKEEKRKYLQFILIFHSTRLPHDKF